MFKSKKILNKAISRTKLRLGLVSVIFNVAILLAYSMLSPWITVILQLLYIVLILKLALVMFSVKQSLLILMILLVPISFISVLGTGYEELPLSWFFVIEWALLVTILAKGPVHKGALLSFLLLVCFGVLSLLQVENLWSALKQLLGIVLFLPVFIIGFNFYREGSKEYLYEVLKSSYIIAALAFAASIIVQYISNSFFGIEVGYMNTYALDRVSYAALMHDFSFASLFLASATILALFAYARYEQNKFWRLAMILAVLMYALVIVNARTGLIALVAGTLLWIIYGTFRGSRRVIISSFMLILALVVIANAIYLNRGEQPLLDSSNRDVAYVSSFTTFINNPLIGIGLGDENFAKYVGDTPLPHNFFIQYLLQTGIIGLGLILLNFAILFKVRIKNDPGAFTALLCVFVGALFIPDILDSRYLQVLIIIAMIGAANSLSKKYSVVQENALNQLDSSSNYLKDLK